MAGTDYRFVEIVLDDPDPDAARIRYLDRIIADARARIQPYIAFPYDPVGTSHWLGPYFILEEFVGGCELRMASKYDQEPSGGKRGVSRFLPIRVNMGAFLADMTGETLARSLAIFVAADVLGS